MAKHQIRMACLKLGCQNSRPKSEWLVWSYDVKIL